MRAISFLFTLLVSVNTYADSSHVVMGTGGVTGVYYPAGGAICQMVNNRFKQHGLRCFVESTQGSVQNLKRLRAGELDLAIVQSDWKSHAWSGTDGFTKYGAHKKLRRVMTLYSEPFTVVARKDANIQTLEDLKGKRVNIGNPGSGQRATMEWLMGKLGWWKSDCKVLHELNSEDQSAGLCAGQFDAMVFVAGSPNSSVKSATTACDSVLVPVISEKLDSAIKDSDIYSKTEIPGGIYRGNPDSVSTFGVTAKLVATSEVEDGMIYALVESVFDDLNNFLRLHPALKHLQREGFVSEEDDVPWHSGALRYYKDSGML